MRSTRELDAEFFRSAEASKHAAANEVARLERDATADRARRQDVDFLADALKQAIASAPDRFSWLDPRRAARLIVSEFRP